MEKGKGYFVNNYGWLNIFFFIFNLCFSNDTLQCMASPLCQKVLKKLPAYEEDEAVNRASSNLEQTLYTLQLIKKNRKESCEKEIPEEELVRVNNSNGKNRNSAKFNEKFPIMLSLVATRNVNLPTIPESLLETPEKATQKNTKFIRIPTHDAVKPAPRKMSPPIICTESAEKNESSNF